MKKSNLQTEELFTDNRGLENCKQCKDCIFRDDGTPWSNHYTKSNCRMFPHPGFKPLRVINNSGICEYYSNEEPED